MAKSSPNRASLLTERAFTAFQHFIHIEAMSGIVLIIAAALALIFVNSPLNHFYETLWHTNAGIMIGNFTLSYDLHFLVNDALMTIFFLVAGMEIRHEIHEGALSNISQAALPILAAIGGVCVPALIYFSLNHDPSRMHGWAVPTATDIAFAVGILALLGKAVPNNLRVFLLSLAIIDDIIAVIIIAVFYSSGLDYNGAIIAVIGIFIVLFLQWIGIASAWIYLIPGIIIWWGLHQLGVHPSLAGVILGMMTPVLAPKRRFSPLKRITKTINILEKTPEKAKKTDITTALKELRQGEKDIVPPVTRIQGILHPWVAFGIMPIFAFANAGVSFAGFDFYAEGSAYIVLGVMLGLFLGKPIGIMVVSFLAVKTGLCRLPPQVNFTNLLLVGFLAGIGFTMAIFVAMLAYHDEVQLNAAKIGVLSGSAISAIVGLLYGLYLFRKNRKS